jgi:hypothetical protein
LPADIPSNPNNTYSNQGWAGYGDWLGTGVIAARLRRYRSFAEARAFARNLKLKSGNEWYQYCKGEMLQLERLPADIPAGPARIYADKGWTGMGDWLGTGNVGPSSREYRSFKSARSYVRNLGLKGEDEWRLYSKSSRPLDIPSAPWNVYAEDGWSGMADWLGTGRTRVSKSPKRKT